VKILYVAPWIPSALRPRSLALLDMLAAGHEVRFLALARNAAEAALADALPVPATLVRNGRVGSYTRSLRALAMGGALQQAYASPRAFGAAFAATLAGWRPDLVHLNVFRTAQLVESCAGTPVVIDLDEFRSEYYDQLAAYGPNPAWRALGRVEASRMRAREEALVAMGVPIILSAPPPAGPLPHTYVVRSPCDLPPRPPVPLAAPVVLFVGRLTYEANVRGLLWFVRVCWAGIRQVVPDARLRIVGSDPPRAVRRLAARDGVELHPDVPDVTPYYAEAAVAVIPVFRGTGVQLKLVQALSTGVPAVVTSAVAARAGVRDGIHVLVADAPAAWVHAVVTLLARDDRAAALAAEGRAWVVAHHGPAVVRRQLDTAYAAVLRAPAPRLPAPRHAPDAPGGIGQAPPGASFR
jgi:glycosyltransferase involved in cell wall biosynthesis